MFWVEEAQSISQTSLEILRPTVSKRNSTEQRSSTMIGRLFGHQKAQYPSERGKSLRA
jgi:hypothetical protein